MIRFPPERQAHWYVRLAYALRQREDLYVTDDELAELQATVPEPATPWAPIDAAPRTGVAWFAGTPVRVNPERAATQTTGAEAWAAEIKRAREAEEQRLRSLLPTDDQWLSKAGIGKPRPLPLGGAT